MKYVHVKNTVHKQSEKDWVSLLRKYLPEVGSLDNKVQGAGYELLCIYRELLEDERLHQCKELGLYVIPKLLSAISYTIPQPFEWEEK